MRNFILLLWAVCAIDAKAQMPTIVEGEALSSNGAKKTVVVVQPENAPNPLGDPIIVPAATIPAEKAEPNNSTEDNKASEKSNLQNSDMTDADFQNTLLEANGRVYDVQSYPEKDLPEISNTANPQTIYSPNVNP